QVSVPGLGLTVPPPLPAELTVKVTKSRPIPLSAESTRPPGVALTCSVAVLLPCEVGVSVTAMLQLAPPARVLPGQGSPAMMNSVPPCTSCTLNMPLVPPPPLWTVKLFWLHTPTLTVPNGSGLGVKLSDAAARPLPCRLELGMPPGVALTVRVAVRSPSADG